MGCLSAGSTHSPTQPDGCHAQCSSSSAETRARQQPRRGSFSQNLVPPDLHVMACRCPSSCPETEPALPMSPLSPSCWPRQAGGDGFGARGCYGDIWSASVLLPSVWEHCKLEIPEAMHQLCTSTCIDKSSALLSPDTGLYHHTQCFQQHPAYHRRSTGELPSPWIRLTCTPHAVSTGRSWAMHQNMHRAGSLIVVSSWQQQHALTENPLDPGLWGGREFPLCILGMCQRDSRKSSESCAREQMFPCWLFPCHLLPQG